MNCGKVLSYTHCIVIRVEHGFALASRTMYQGEISVDVEHH